jgi:hypothetical protein
MAFDLSGRPCAARHEVSDSLLPGFSNSIDVPSVPGANAYWSITAEL